MVLVSDLDTDIYFWIRILVRQRAVVESDQVFVPPYPDPDPYGYHFWTRTKPYYEWVWVQIRYIFNVPIKLTARVLTTKACLLVVGGSRLGLGQFRG